MMVHQFRILLTFLFLTPIGLLAQRDFLVTVKGDTVAGKISILLVGKIEQAIVKGEKRETFSAPAVREINLANVRYKPVQFAGSIQFMQVLNEGYLSMLAFKPQGVMSFDGRLLQTRDGRTLEVPTIGFKKQLSSFLKDNEPLATKIQNGELDRNDLDKIIGEYNAHVSGNSATLQQQTQMNENQKPKLELLADLKTGVEKSSLESRQDVLDMLNDLEEKIKTNKAIPPYLRKIIKANLGTNQDLTSQFNELAKVL